MTVVTYRPSGRLGNQLQLWACARTLSLEYGWDFDYQPIVHADRFLLDYPPALRRWRDRARGSRLVLDWSGVFVDLSPRRGELIAELLGDHDAAVPRRAGIGVHVRRDDSAHPLPIDH